MVKREAKHPWRAGGVAPALRRWIPTLRLCVESSARISAWPQGTLRETPNRVPICWSVGVLEYWVFPLLHHSMRLLHQSALLRRRLPPALRWKNGGRICGGRRPPLHGFSLDAEKRLLPTAGLPCFICRTQNINAQLLSPSGLWPGQVRRRFLIATTPNQPYARIPY
jgi:hypothetical protein